MEGERGGEGMEGARERRVEQWEEGWRGRRVEGERDGGGEGHTSQ